jgi:multidrug resistance efflux pump
MYHSNKKINQLHKLYYLALMTIMACLMPYVNVSAAENNEYKITSPISAVIKKLHVTPGKIVHKGDLLIEFDDTLIISNLSEAKENIALAILSRDEAKKELGRAKELYERTVLSEHELQMAKISYAQTKMQYARAKNKLVHAQWELHHTKLFSSIEGQVGRIFAYPGQYVNNEFSAQTLLIINTGITK